jgi:hypothetical protein
MNGTEASGGDRAASLAIQERLYRILAHPFGVKAQLPGGQRRYLDPVVLWLARQENGKKPAGATIAYPVAYLSRQIRLDSDDPGKLEDVSPIQCLTERHRSQPFHTCGQVNAPQVKQPGRKLVPTAGVHPPVRIDYDL